VEQVSADRAFDTPRVSGAIAGRGAQAAIPPRQNARAAPSEHASPGPRLRDAGSDPEAWAGGVDTEERVSSTPSGRKRERPP
jgi:hypothetical protein